MDAQTRKSLTKKFFEQELDSYGDVVPGVGQEASELSISLREIEFPSTAWVLDISTGTGFVIEQVLSTFPGSRIAGLDFSEKILRSASRRFPSASFQIADAEFLPFRDRVFSLAVCRYSIHHFPNILGHLGEVRRVLKSGGTYLIIDPVPFEGAFDREINRAFRAAEARVTGHVRFYTEKRYRALLSKAGLRLAATRRYPVRISLSRTVHKALLEPLLSLGRSSLIDRAGS